MKWVFYAIALVGCSIAAEAANRVAPAPPGPDITRAYIGRDFSALLEPKTAFIGFTGSDFRRLKIHYSQVEKDVSDPALYHVTGSSEVGANHCSLSGTIKVLKLTGAKSGILRDEVGKDIGIRFRGSLNGRYDIKENGPAAVCGTFHGTLQLDWALDRDGKLRYDDSDAVSDGYANNQYEGTWSLAGKTKTANWGEYRIPGSMELDCGAGEFVPCDAYKDKGWAGYPLK